LDLSACRGHRVGSSRGRGAGLTLGPIGLLPGSRPVGSTPRPPRTAPTGRAWP